MNANLTILTTVLLTAQAFAGVEPATIRSMITGEMRSQYTQEEARSMEDLCQLSQNKEIIKWGNEESKLTCNLTSQGHLEITAENHLGKVSIFANPKDMAIVDIVEGDYSYQYTNDIHQQFYLKLTFKKYNASNRPAGSTLKGYYAADLSLRDNSAKIHIGSSLQDYRP
ncbi:MAG TPA: hypothetical protein VIG33_04460 [Pseudobdellovibrionaceae bacterium]|jgi:hypothetical protein